MFKLILILKSFVNTRPAVQRVSRFKCIAQVYVLRKCFSKTVSATDPNIQLVISGSAYLR